MYNAEKHTTLEPSLYNLAVLKMTTAGDDDFLIKVLSTFLNNNKDLIARLHKAFEDKKYLEIGDIAHKMLSSYKHLEVNTIIDALTKLETLTFGGEMLEEDVGRMVRFISVQSKKVFEGIENEIMQIKNN